MKEITIRGNIILELKKFFAEIDKIESTEINNRIIVIFECHKYIYYNRLKIVNYLSSNNFYKTIIKNCKKMLADTRINNKYDLIKILKSNKKFFQSKIDE